MIYENTLSARVHYRRMHTRYANKLIQHVLSTRKERYTHRHIWQFCVAVYSRSAISGHFDVAQALTLMSTIGPGPCSAVCQPLYW